MLQNLTVLQKFCYFLKQFQFRYENFILKASDDVVHPCFQVFLIYLSSIRKAILQSHLVQPAAVKNPS